MPERCQLLEIDNNHAVIPSMTADLPPTLKKINGSNSTFTAAGSG
jgi:hypothetical protein